MEALEAHWKDWESGEVDESYVRAKKWVEASTGAIDGSYRRTHGSLCPMEFHYTYMGASIWKLPLDFNSTSIQLIF